MGTPAARAVPDGAAPAPALLTGCTAQVRLPGSQPPTFRHCLYPVADGEHKCARHGGKPITKRPKRPRSLVSGLMCWLSKYGWRGPKLIQTKVLDKCNRTL